jgi:hypothetical protein
MNALTDVLLPWTDSASHQFQDPSGWGTIGDYVGGIYGTLSSVILGTITIYLLRREYRRGKNEEIKSRSLTHFYHLHDSLRAIAEPLRKHETNGGDKFANIVQEFQLIYERFAISISSSVLERSQLLNIAYIFAFFGTTMNAKHILRKIGYSEILVVDLAGRVESLKKEHQKRTGAFCGHQKELGNYYRSLYSAYKFLQNSPFSCDEQYEYSKSIRTEMTTHEQAALALNALSVLGKKWLDEGLIGEFQIIKNVPEDYFDWKSGAHDFKIDMKSWFPNIVFEYNDFYDLDIKYDA